MPGRTPAEAFSAFIEPLKLAVSCLGQVKITTSPGGRNDPDKDHSWTLNSGRGYTAKGKHLEAQMMYRIIFDDERETWRVRTVMYRYRFAVTDREVFLMHWHPGGKSDVETPHMHLDLAIGDTLKEHLPCKRQTFEDAIRWAMAFGLEPARDDWRELLDLAEAEHLEYRTWQ